MASSVLVVAESASGKSTSGRNLNPAETFWINVAGKPLPFKGWKTKYPVFDKENPKGRLSNVNTSKGVIDAMKYVSAKRPEIKTLIIDDWQYVSSFEFFKRASETGFTKFTEIGQGIAAMAKTPINLREDLLVVFLTHVEEMTDDKGRKKQKAKTIGKLVDDKLTLEGLFSIVLFGKAYPDKNGVMQYVFETQTDGANTCKTPMGMFSEKEIPNDLQIVRDAIIEYEQ